MGNSPVSVAGNGVRILTNPDAPTSLVNNAAVTGFFMIGMTWTAPSFVGGTPVIDYRVSWDQGGSTFTVLATNVTTTSYSTPANLQPMVLYKFKVESRNAYGYSTSFTNEVTIRAQIAGTTAPNQP